MREVCLAAFERAVIGLTGTSDSSNVLAAVIDLTLQSGTLSVVELVDTCLRHATAEFGQTDDATIPHDTRSTHIHIFARALIVLLNRDGTSLLSDADRSRVLSAVSLLLTSPSAQLATAGVDLIFACTDAPLELALAALRHLSPIASAHVRSDGAHGTDSLLSSLAQAETGATMLSRIFVRCMSALSVSDGTMPEVMLERVETLLAGLPSENSPIVRTSALKVAPQGPFARPGSV
jgi:hypothetical protein